LNHKEHGGSTQRTQRFSAIYVIFLCKLCG
jgi:hypothetical protein